MKDFIKKIYVAITLLSVTTISDAYGSYDNSSCGDGTNCYTCQPDCCGTGFVSADLLYWRPFQDGLDTCVPTEVSNTVSGDRVISRFKGKGRNPDFNWDPGFRIGAGFNFACSEWDVAAYWTHFHSSANNSLNRENKIRWNINLDVIDLLAGYTFDFGNCFIVKPFGGLRGAIIDEKLHIKGFSSPSGSSSRSSSSGSSSSIDLISGTRHNKENFYGIGPLVGLEGDWNIGCGFSIFANGSISNLYGNFNVKLKETDETVDTLDDCRVKKRFDASLLAADAALGVRWETCFCENKRLILQCGLEHHRYFDYNRIGSCCGDLSFDGVNFSAGIEF